MVYVVYCVLSIIESKAGGFFITTSQLFCLV